MRIVAYRPPTRHGSIAAAEAQSGLPPEPAATPASGREDDELPPATATPFSGSITSPDDGTPPEWATEETERPFASAGSFYVLKDTRGDVIETLLTANAFIEQLRGCVAKAGSPGEARTWKARNQLELQRLAYTEVGELANDALDLLS